MELKMPNYKELDLSDLKMASRNKLIQNHRNTLVTLKDEEFTPASTQFLSQSLEPHEIRTLQFGRNWGKEGTFIIDGHIEAGPPPNPKDYPNEIEYIKAAALYHHELNN